MRDDWGWDGKHCCDSCKYWNWQEEEYTEESTTGYLNWGYCEHPLSPYYHQENWRASNKVCGFSGCSWHEHLV